MKDGESVKKVLFKLFAAAIMLQAALLCLQCTAHSYEAEELARVYTHINNSYSLKYGYADKYGNLRIPYIYDYACEFSCGYALVSKNGKSYYIDKNNKTVFGSDDGTYKFYYDFSEDLCVASRDGKFGFLNKDGSVAIDFVYDDAYSFSEGLACVGRDNKLGYINRNGEEVIGFEYDSAGAFESGRARVSMGGKYGFIDVQGNRCVPIIYEKATEFCEDVSCVRLEGGYTYVNRNGYIYFPPVFEQAGRFINGSALVKLDGKYGRIRLDGTYKIRAKFDSLREFIGKYAVAGVYIYDGVMRYGFIDEYGNRVSALTYEKIDYEDGVYSLYKNGKVTFADEELRDIGAPENL